MLGNTVEALPSTQRVTAPARADPRARLQAAVRENYQFIWRSLRRLGIQDGDVDDAAQAVLTVFSKRLADIDEGSERSFLFQTAVRVASDARRSQARSRLADDPRAIAVCEDTAPNPEE